MFFIDITKAISKDGNNDKPHYSVFFRECSKVTTADKKEYLQSFFMDKKEP